MPIKEIISLEKFRWTVQESVNEIEKEFPNLFFDYAGIIPNNDSSFRYDCTPINTSVFAYTGGDGVHYSILEISETIQPIIMTVPMSCGNSAKENNWILGENLYEFLSLGYYNGWFPLEQLCYDQAYIIDFYTTDNQEVEYQHLYGGIHLLKMLRTKLGYGHRSLNLNRLKELEELYFDLLQFEMD